MLKRSVLAGFFLLTAAMPLAAQTPVTVGAGLQTSFVHSDVTGAPNTTDNFLVNSVRLYVNGAATDHVKFMLNTEYNGVTNAIGVLDAVAQFSTSPQMNIWVGRFIAPSDRANLYGPYYSHHWAVYTDSVQDGYPSVLNNGIPTGRDNGVMWWGQFNKVKISAGGFDGPSLTGNKNVMGAARVQVDLWDAEDGYYLNGTYYGAKDLLAFGLAAEVQDGVGTASANTAWSADLLLEKKMSGGGVVSFESEYAKYKNQFVGYNPTYASSDGGYGLGAYLFPQMVGPGKFEVLGKFAFARFQQGASAIFNPNYNQKTTEIDLNYIFKEFNGRLMIFFKNTDFNRVNSDGKQIGVGLQIQM